MWSNAAGEGWALYAEQLAAEMGMYDDDPYGDLGRLQAELHRAVRLVVDTGMHAMKWSREQAIDYMVDTEGVEESTAVTEVERYAVWPGQALGYKLGMLKILELREEAQQQLGDRFDIREVQRYGPAGRGDAAAVYRGDGSRLDRAKGHVISTGQPGSAGLCVS